MKKQKLSFSEKIEALDQLIKQYELGFFSRFDLLEKIYKIGWETSDERDHIEFIIIECVTVDTVVFKTLNKSLKND